MFEQTNCVSLTVGDLEEIIAEKVAPLERRMDAAFAPHGLPYRVPYDHLVSIFLFFVLKISFSFS
jgi:hypothetical protein